MNTPPLHCDDKPENSAFAPHIHAVEHYTPRHARRKIFMIAFGLILFAYGLSELWTPLFLLFDGSSAMAEATRVIKTKEGLPDQVFSDDLHLNAAEETKDRGYVFWNEFRFSTPDGADHTVRLKIGSQLKPLFPLLDGDGIPTNVTVYYDPKNPEQFCVPIVQSTWFAPGLIAFMGLVCALYGSVLLYWAHRQIEIP